MEWSNSPAGEILDYRQQKRQQFNLFKKTSGTKVSGENITMNDRSPNEIKHTWQATSCFIVGDPIIIAIYGKRLSKNRSVKVPDFRDATLTDINHLIPILKNKPDVIVLHLGTNRVRINVSWFGKYDAFFIFHDSFSHLPRKSRYQRRFLFPKPRIKNNSFWLLKVLWQIYARSKSSWSSVYKKNFSLIWQAVFELGYVFCQER